MSTFNMFKRAYVRGVMQNLTQRGAVAFPDEAFATRVADNIAERVAFEILDPKTVPDFNDAYAVKSAQLSLLRPTDQTVAAIAQNILKAAEYAAKHGHQCRQLTKAASVRDLEGMADFAAVHLYRMAEGSTIEGGDKGNATPSTGEGVMDDKNRPAGYAENAQGTTQTDVRPGATGTERPAPNQQNESPTGNNSVVDQSRTANLNTILGRITKRAEGSTIEGGDKGNDTPSTGEGKMDDKNRPPGYAGQPQGARGDIGVEAARAAIGGEQPAPNTQANSPGGSNSVIEQARTASDLSPEFVELFNKVASQVRPLLPASMDRVKAASLIQELMPLGNEKRARAVAKFLNEEKAPRRAKAAGDNPFEKMVEDYRDGEGGKDDKDKKDDKKDGDKSDAFKDNQFKKKEDGDKKDDKDKKDDDKKEGSLLEFFTRKAGG